MLMSQRAISSALTAAPNAGSRDGACAAQATRLAAPAAMTMRLDVDIFHAPVRAHRPAYDGVVVIDHSRRILRKPRLARRLHAPLLVGRAALQHRLLALPLPGQAEEHQGLRALLSGERGVRPGRATVGGDFDAADAPGAAPGDAGDLVEPGA